MKKLLLQQFQFYKDLADEKFKTLSEEQMFSNNSIELSVADLISDFIKNSNSVETTLPEKDKLLNKKSISLQLKSISKVELMSSWEESCKHLRYNLEQLLIEDFNNEQSFSTEYKNSLETSIIILSDFSYQVGQIVSTGNIFDSSTHQPSDLPSDNDSKYSAEEKNQDDQNQIQQNSSPVCFAKSDEIRDDYKI